MTVARFSGIAGIGVVGVLSVCSSRMLLTISAAAVNISLEVVSFTKALTSVAMLVQQRGRFVWGRFDRLIWGRFGHTHGDVLVWRRFDWTPTRHMCQVDLFTKTSMQCAELGLLQNTKKP